LPDFRGVNASSSSGLDGTGFYLSIGELRLFSGLQVLLRELPGRPVLGTRRLRRLVVADDLLGGRVETQLAATGKRDG